MPVSLLALTFPVTKPVNVTVTGTLASMSPLPDVVITRAVGEGAAAVPATLKELMATAGAGQPGAKKYVGKKRVIRPPDSMEPVPLGVNVNVAALLG
jgi:hypothetical protein